LSAVIFWLDSHASLQRVGIKGDGNMHTTQPRGHGRAH